MKKESTDLLPCQPMLVSSPLTSISIVERFMTGAHVATLRTPPSAMASASGSWPDAVQWHSTFQNQATLSYAIAKCRPMPLSAMEHINKSSDGFTDNTVASGAWMVFSVSGCASPTGCSLSTSEQLLDTSAPNTAKYRLYATIGVDKQ